MWAGRQKTSGSQLQEGAEAPGCWTCPTELVGRKRYSIILSKAVITYDFTSVRLDRIHLLSCSYNLKGAVCTLKYKQETLASIPCGKGHLFM